MGIDVLPPDVNESQVDFAPAAEGIRYGLSAVRNVGIGAVQQIIAARDAKGRFESFADFCRKVDSGVLHKKVLESLVLAGAFDSLGYARKALLEGYWKVSDPIFAERKAEAAGQFSLFGGGEQAIETFDESVLVGEEFGTRELLRQEKEMLGQYVTDHPLLPIKDRLAAQTDMEISEVGTLGDGDVVTVAGIVGAVQRKFTKRGEPYAVFRLEDLTGGVGIVAFPGTFDKAADLVASDQVILVKGRADLRGRELQLLALEIGEPDLSSPEVVVAPRAATEPLIIDLSPSVCTPGLIARLKQLFVQHVGSRPVVLQLVVDGEGTRLRLGEESCVDGSPGLLAELLRLLGPEAVHGPAADQASTSAGPRIAATAGR